MATKKPWWHRNRELNRRIPQKAINECSYPGRPADKYVKKWVEELEFEAPVEETREYLKGFGYWSDEELADHQENLLRLFWDCCCRLKEEPYYGVYLER